MTLKLKEFTFILAHGIKKQTEIGKPYTQNEEISSFLICNSYLHKKYKRAYR